MRQRQVGEELEIEFCVGRIGAQFPEPPHVAGASMRLQGGLAARDDSGERALPAAVVVEHRGRVAKSTAIASSVTAPWSPVRRAAPETLSQIKSETDHLRANERRRT